TVPGAWSGAGASPRLSQPLADASDLDEPFAGPVFDRERGLAPVIVLEGPVAFDRVVGRLPVDGLPVLVPRAVQFRDRAWRAEQPEAIFLLRTVIPGQPVILLAGDLVGFLGFDEPPREEGACFDEHGHGLALQGRVGISHGDLIAPIADDAVEHLHLDRALG